MAALVVTGVSGRSRAAGMEGDPSQWRASSVFVVRSFVLEEDLVSARRNMASPYLPSTPLARVTSSHSFSQSPGTGYRALSAAGPTEAERKLATVKPVNGRVDVSGWNLGSIDGLLPSAKVEALYARSNGLRTIAGLPVLPQLRVLDVSGNLLTDVYIPKCPLRMLFLSANNISDVSVIPTIPTLEVLSLSNNKLKSLQGMNPQPELKVCSSAIFFVHIMSNGSQVLSLSGNELSSWWGLPIFPKLESLRASDNPLARTELYRLMSISGCGGALTRLDGEPVDAVKSDLSLRACYAIRRGLVLQRRDNADEQASVFLETVVKASLSPCTMYCYSLYLSCTISH
jgi:hypothetical protein